MTLKLTIEEANGHTLKIDMVLQTFIEGGGPTINVLAGENIYKGGALYKYMQGFRVEISTRTNVARAPIADTAA